MPEERIGIVVNTGSALSVAGNAKSSDQVTGTYQFLPFNALVRIFARASATGLNVQLYGDGAVVANDQVIPFTGTAGGISMKDNPVASGYASAGTRLELYFRNTTAGAITVDFLLVAEPM